jgi:hypothetical protein
LLENCKCCFIIILFYRALDNLHICVFYAMKTSKNACIIRSECTFTHTYCCVSKLSKFGAYLYAVDDQIIHRVHKQYIFDFEKFPVITSNHISHPYVLRNSIITFFIFNYAGCSDLNLSKQFTKTSR